ncbi:hypothetical protein REPUB_Repub12eG0136100 [Reevesia pubescens]
MATVSSPISIAAPCEFITQASTIEVIKLILEAKTKLPVNSAKFKDCNYIRNGEDPFAPEWGRFGFNQVDYGWGPPVHLVPTPSSAIIPIGIMGSLPLPKKGIRLMTWCVEEGHRQPFLGLMTKLI